MEPKYAIWCIIPYLLPSGIELIRQSGITCLPFLNTEFSSRLSALDAYENRFEHDCWRESGGVKRYGECRYLVPRDEGGLPATTQFQALWKIFSNRGRVPSKGKKYMTGTSGIDVILRHLGHLNQMLVKPGLDDTAKNDLYSEAHDMLQLLEAMLHSTTCKEHASEYEASESEHARACARELHQVQNVMVQGGALLRCLDFIQSKSEKVMKAAFRLFVAVQVRPSKKVQVKSHEALDTTAGAAALTKLKEELEISLIRVTDNLAHADMAFTSQSYQEENTSDRPKGLDDVGSFVANQLDQSANLVDSLMKQIELDSSPSGSRPARSNADSNAGSGTPLDAHRAALSGSAHDVLNPSDDNVKVSTMAGVGEETQNFNLMAYSWCLNVCHGIGSIVDGGLDSLKEAFREQRENSVNFVSVLCKALHQLPQDVKSPIHQKLWLELTAEILWALSELCVGNPKNQLAAFEGGGVVEHIGRTLKHSHHNNFSSVVMSQHRALSLIGMMVEGNVHRLGQFPRNVKSAIGVIGVRAAMNSYYFVNMFCEKFGKDGTNFPKKRSEALIDNAFRCYWLLRRLTDLTAEDCVKESEPAYWDEEEEDSEEENSDDENENENENEALALITAPLNIIIPHDLRDALAGHEQEETETDGVLRIYKGYDEELKIDIEKLIDEQSKAQRRNSVNVADPTTDQLNQIHQGIVGADEKQSGHTKKADKFDIFYSEILIRFQDNGTSSRYFDRVKYFEIASRSIEFMRNAELEKLYFRFSELKMMSQVHRSRVLEELDWSSPQDKVRCFVEKFENIRGTLKVQQSLRGKWWARFVADGMSVAWQRAVLILTYALNILMLSALSVDNSPGHNATSIVDAPLPSWYSSAVGVLGTLHVIVSVGVVVQYFTNESSGQDVFSLLTAGTESLFYICFLAASIGGLLYHGYFFAFHLLYIVQNNKNLKSAVSAITRNGAGLLWVTGLAITIVYLFAVVMYLFFRQDFDDNEGLHCNSLGDCFTTLLVAGLELGGLWELLGAGVAAPDTTFSGNQIGRFVVNFLFWVILTVIMMNLVLGIIVDTFSQLRQELATREDEMANKCFICSLPSYKFDKHGGFKKHKREDHNMWMYVYYTMYLEELPDSSRSHHEEFLYEQWVVKKSPAPFPIMKSMVLHGSETEDGDDALGVVLKKLSDLERASSATQENLGLIGSSLRDRLETMRGDILSQRSHSPVGARVRRSTIDPWKKAAAKITSAMSFNKR